MNIATVLCAISANTDSKRHARLAMSVAERWRMPWNCHLQHTSTVKDAPPRLIVGVGLGGFVIGSRGANVKGESP